MQWALGATSPRAQRVASHATDNEAREVLDELRLVREQVVRPPLQAHEPLLRRWQDLVKLEAGSGRHDLVVLPADQQRPAFCQALKRHAALSDLQIVHVDGTVQSANASDE